MSARNALTQEIVAKATSLRKGICAGIVPLDDVLRGPSYKAKQDGPGRTTLYGNDVRVEWPTGAATVLILGLYHPKNDPRLDWWERGDTIGNRNLRRISQSLKRWLAKQHGINAIPLPYHVENGGIYLKDAAALAGLGVVGRNNLVIHPQWGPRVRWRSILIKEALAPTARLKKFAPCDTCEGFCHRACPTAAFGRGWYERSACVLQMNADEARRDADGRFDVHGRFHAVIKYCRACELACPVGT